jgi:hypothetical protein
MTRHVVPDRLRLGGSKVARIEALGFDRITEHNGFCGLPSYYQS